MNRNNVYILTIQNLISHQMVKFLKSDEIFFEFFPQNIEQILLPIKVYRLLLQLRRYPLARIKNSLLNVL